MKRSARDFRNTNVLVEPGTDLQFRIWYRSPLSKDDHLLGETFDHVDDLISWCGWGLGLARDWVDDEYGGLWYSSRTSNRCSECNRRQTEYEEAVRIASGIK